MVAEPAERIRWRQVKSTNVIAIGWDKKRHLYVRFHGVPADTVYMYEGVSRQRAVAASRAKSVGRYINKVIKPQFKAVRVI